jgi:hypothetical protein
MPTSEFNRFLRIHESESNSECDRGRLPFESEDDLKTGGEYVRCTHMQLCSMTYVHTTHRTVLVTAAVHQPPQTSVSEINDDDRD